MGTVIFNLQQIQAAKLRKPLTEVSKIDSKKRHAVFNNFKETDLRLFIKKKTTTTTTITAKNMKKDGLGK